MRFFSKHYLLLTAGEKARRQHQSWLNRAMRRDTRTLRIPVRRMELGGFSALRSAPGGMQWAEQWWTEAMTRADMVSET